MTWLYELRWRFTSIYPEQQQLELMYLDGRNPGRVLEVGCGDGARLAKLRTLGWEVQGQEIDEKAAAQARKSFELPIFLGSLDRAGFKDEEFDAVVMSHVLEHVHDPVRLLEECKRVLKPGGLLVSITPNAQGWGHSHFGACWYGLDPPRHLLLFSRSTLQQIALKCGFRDVKTWTTAARSLWTVRGSLRIESKQTMEQGMWPAIKRRIREVTLHTAAVTAQRRNPDAGEECVLSASK